MPAIMKLGESKYTAEYEHNNCGRAGFTRYTAEPTQAGISTCVGEQEKIRNPTFITMAPFSVSYFPVEIIPSK